MNANTCRVWRIDTRNILYFVFYSFHSGIKGTNILTYFGPHGRECLH